MNLGLFLFNSLIALLFSNEKLIAKFKADLEVELTKKGIIDGDLKFAERIIINIQSSFKHFKQILRQIGEDYVDQVDLESSSGESNEFFKQIRKY